MAQGKGAVLSPFLFLIFIKELLVVLISSGLGLCIFDINCTCPTFADDMYLAFLSKFGLNRLLAMCYNYYIRGWSGGAMALGKLPGPGRPTILVTVGQGQ